MDLDHDIYLYDGSGKLVANSSSWDNSYEIIDFNGNKGKFMKLELKDGVVMVIHGMVLHGQQVMVCFGEL